jgi:hypothetical protein
VHQKGGYSTRVVYRRAYIAIVAAVLATPGEHQGASQHATNQHKSIAIYFHSITFIN